jgi:predicted nucleotidyltransferase component of viral defense system
MTSSIEQSLKKRLQHIARERNLTPAEVWQNVILERFMVRLCHSSYRSNFILKGGILLAKHINIGRETKDIDFSVEGLSNDIQILSKVIEEITLIDMGDGFEFKNIKIEPLDHFHMHYPGARIRIEVCLGKARLPLFIDLGFGDHVHPKEENILLLANSKGPLFESMINLKCYPLEFIFAEKLETIVYRGTENSRMKDYHDLLSIIQSKEVLDIPKLKTAIQAVFKHRKTPLQIPIHFKTASLQTLQNYWQRYQPTVAIPTSLPSQIERLIDSINLWLMQHNISLSASNYRTL